jgi:hypothetical protein
VGVQCGLHLVGRLDLGGAVNLSDAVNLGGALQLGAAGHLDGSGRAEVGGHVVGQQLGFGRLVAEDSLAGGVCIGCGGAAEQHLLHVGVHAGGFDAQSAKMGRSSVQFRIQSGGQRCLAGLARGVCQQGSGVGVADRGIQHLPPLMTAHRLEQAQLRRPGLCRAHRQRVDRRRGHGHFAGHPRFGQQVQRLLRIESLNI